MFMFDIEAFGVVVLLCHLPAMPLEDFSDDQSSRLGLVEYCALQALAGRFCFSILLPRVFSDHRALSGVFFLRAIIASIGRASRAMEGVGRLVLSSRLICQWGGCVSHLQ
jgi:hypothetical protein